MTAAYPGAGPAIGRATLIAGALSLAANLTIEVASGDDPARLLRSIASGPLGPGAAGWKIAGPPIGVIVHLLLTAAMAWAYARAAAAWPAMTHRPILAGLAYGLLVWSAMALVILPLRWPALYPDLDPLAAVPQLLTHMLFVGLPIAVTLRK